MTVRGQEISSLDKNSYLTPVTHLNTEKNVAFIAVSSLATHAHPLAIHLNRIPSEFLTLAIDAVSLLAGELLPALDYH